MSTPHLVVLEKVGGGIVRLDPSDEIYAPESSPPGLDAGLELIQLEDVRRAVTERSFVEYVSESRFVFPAESEWEDPKGTGWIETRVRVFSRNVITATEFLEEPDV